MNKKRGDRMKNINGCDKSLFREVTSDRTSKSKAAIRRKLDRIRHKLMAGGRLTAEEKAFLRRYAPALYELAMSMEREREAYEERLKQCRTREEAERIKMEKMVEMGSAKEEDAETKIIRMAQIKAAEETTAAAVNKKPSQTEKEKKKQKAEKERKEAQKLRERKKAAKERRDRERTEKELREEEYRETERLRQEQEARYMEKETGIIYGRPINSTVGQVRPLPGAMRQEVVFEEMDEVYMGGGEFAKGLAAYQAVLQEGIQ